MSRYRRLHRMPMAVEWLEAMRYMAPAFQAGELHITKRCRVPEGWVL